MKYGVSGSQRTVSIRICISLIHLLKCVVTYKYAYFVKASFKKLSSKRTVWFLCIVGVAVLPLTLQHCDAPSLFPELMEAAGGSGQTEIQV